MEEPINRSADPNGLVNAERLSVHDPSQGWKQEQSKWGGPCIKRMFFRWSRRYSLQLGSSAEGTRTLGVVLSVSRVVLIKSEVTFKRQIWRPYVILSWYYSISHFWIVDWLVLCRVRPNARPPGVVSGSLVNNSVSFVCAAPIRPAVILHWSTGERVWSLIAPRVCFVEKKSPIAWLHLAVFARAHFRCARAIKLIDIFVYKLKEKQVTYGCMLQLPLHNSVTTHSLQTYAFLRAAVKGFVHFTVLCPSTRWKTWPRSNSS